MTALIHLHTTASDGRATPDDIARLAAQAGESVVLLTDHDRLFPGSGWRYGVLVLAGQELSPRHNHILAAGLECPLPKQRGDGHNGTPGGVWGRPPSAGPGTPWPIPWTRRCPSSSARGLS